MLLMSILLSVQDKKKLIAFSLLFRFENEMA